MKNDNVILNKSKFFAIRIIKLYKYLSDEKKEFVLSKQVLRSGTSIGANEREAARAQSKADFIAKQHIALKEADETCYWLELLHETDYVSDKEFESIYSEANELIKLLVAIIKSAKANKNSSFLTLNSTFLILNYTHQEIFMCYNVVSESEESTVVSEYKSEEKRSDAYQSEEELEKEFIHLLTEMSYEYLPIHNKDELLPNLRKKLEELNNYAFTDTEWEQFYNNCIAGKNDGIVEKTRRIQEDNVQILHRDNGETKNITLFDKKNIHNNKLQVIHQYEENGGRYKNRYDVTILVNGLPLVHI